MQRLIRIGLAAALTAAPVSLLAADNADTERAFATAARGFSNCLFAAAEAATPRADLANVCLLQEAAFRQNGIRLRLSRGQAEQQAATETEADIFSSRRMALADRAQRYALAR